MVRLSHLCGKCDEVFEGVWFLKVCVECFRVRSCHNTTRVYISRHVGTVQRTRFGILVTASRSTLHGRQQIPNTPVAAIESPGEIHAEGLTCLFDGCIPGRGVQPSSDRNGHIGANLAGLADTASTYSSMSNVAWMWQPVRLEDVHSVIFVASCCCY